MEKFTYKVYPWSVIEKARISKERLSKWMGIDRVTFDYALPQEWLDRFVTEHKLPYDQVLSTTFYAYPRGNQSGIVSGCLEIDDLLKDLPGPNWERTVCGEAPVEVR